MAFDNHYPNRKDWRKPYRRSAAFDSGCRPHGDCPYCEHNRLRQQRRAQEWIRFEIDDWWDGYSDYVYSAWSPIVCCE